MTYTYDAMDRRISKTVDGTVTAYVYDMSADDPLAHDDILLAFDSTTSPSILTRRWAHSDSVDEPLGFEGYNASGGPGTGTERAMFADRQGSVIWVTDPATGDVVAAYEYDGYGQITQTQGSLVQPYGYTGREYDAESGLYYYRARGYDPRNGVFLQSDPIGFEGGQYSLYQYVAANPFGHNDPEGLMSSIMLSRNTALNEANNMYSNSAVFAGLAATAGVLSRALLELDLAGMGNPVGGIPRNKGICSKQMVAWFDEIKPHADRCQSGKEFIGWNLSNMRIIQTEIYIRTLELAMCYEGGARGNSGHPKRVGNLFKMQKDCKRRIENGVISESW